MAEALFVDDEYLSQAEKADLLAQWQRFFRSGFNPLFLTGGLYRYLVRGCGVADQVSREQFWAVTGGAATSRQSRL